MKKLLFIMCIGIANIIFSQESPILKDEHYQVSFITNGQSIQTTNSWDIKLVDINGDGNLDAYLGGKTWLNNGNGNLSETDLSFGSGFFASFGDLNGDGFVDVVCQDSIYINNGDNHYEFKIKISSDILMYSSVLADVDNDGDIDIISCSTATDRILFNDGKANFTDSGKSLGGWGQASYAFGDINSDGFTDIYVAIPHTPPPTMKHAENKIWFGSAEKKFTERSHDITGAVSRNAILCDFDNDGDIDLFLASNSDGGNMIFFNDGKGNFKDSGQVLGNNSNAAKVSDLDGDGDFDLFICYGKVPMGDGAPNKVWYNDGKGHFTDSKLSLGNSNSAAIALGDMNKDGRIDAVIVNVKLDAKNSYASAPCPVEIWLNKAFESNYLNETEPGDMPVLFGKDIVSVEGKNTHACTFSPDGKQLYFSRYPDRKSYVMTFENGQWSNPREAFFHGKETSISASNEKLFYYRDGDIYFNEKTEEDWGKAVKAGSKINSSEMEYFPSITNDGTLFFSRNGNWDKGRIMYSKIVDGEYAMPVDIGLPVNLGGASHAYVAPDKSYMIFNSPREGSFTKLDLWISYNKDDDSWTEPQNLGKNINSAANAILCPTVSPDGKYIFFTRLQENGTGYVYWVSTNIIDKLREKNL